MAKPNFPRSEDLNVLTKVLSVEIDSLLSSLKRRGMGVPSLKQLAPSSSSNTDSEAEKSKQSIAYVCEKIIALIKGPASSYLTELDGYIINPAISIAVTLKLPQRISSERNAPTHIDELVELTGASKELLSGSLQSCNTHVLTLSRRTYSSFLDATLHI